MSQKYNQLLLKGEKLAVKHLNSRQIPRQKYNLLKEHVLIMRPFDNALIEKAQEQTAGV